MTGREPPDSQNGRPRQETAAQEYAAQTFYSFTLPYRHDIGGDGR